MIVRLVCVLASSSCIGTEPAAYIPENVESENTELRAVNSENFYGAKFYVYDDTRRRTNDEEVGRRKENIHLFKPDFFLYLLKHMF